MFKSKFINKNIETTEFEEYVCHYKIIIQIKLYSSHIVWK